MKGEIYLSRGTVYNKIVTEELLSQVNEDNMELMDEWIDYLNSVDRSSQTIKQYINNLKIFWIWNLKFNKNKFFAKFSKRDMTKYQNYLLGLGHSPSRIRVLRATLSSLSKYIENILDEEDEFKGFKNIINKIEAPTGEAVREKTVISDEEMESLLNELVKNKRYQLACYIALGAYGGARKSELLRFKADYFKDEHIVSGLYKTPEKITTKGRGSKGKMLHKFTIVSYFKPYLEAWLEERGRLGIDSEWLFVRKIGGKYEQAIVSTADSWSNTVSREFNINFYSHALRHFYVSALSRANIPPEVIKDITGWADVSLVSVYNDNDVEDSFDKYFSDGGVIKQDKSEGLGNL